MRVEREVKPNDHVNCTIRTLFSVKRVTNETAERIPTPGHGDVSGNGTKVKTVQSDNNKKQEFMYVHTKIRKPEFFMFTEFSIIGLISPHVG